MHFGLRLAIAAILAAFHAPAPVAAQDEPALISSLSPDELKAFVSARLPAEWTVSGPFVNNEGRPMIRVHEGKTPTDANVYFVAQLIGCKDVSGVIRCPALYFVHYLVVPASEYETEAASLFAINWIARVVGPGRIVPKGVRFDGKAELMIDHWITIHGGVSPANLWRQFGEFEYTMRQVKGDWANR